MSPVYKHTAPLGLWVGQDARPTEVVRLIYILLRPDKSGFKTGAKDRGLNGRAGEPRPYGYLNGSDSSGEFFSSDGHEAELPSRHPAFGSEAGLLIFNAEVFRLGVEVVQR